MSNDPFNRNKTKEARLGEIITEAGEQNQRDAVHIAVVPCIASCDLLPGQHVGVTADGKYSMRPGTTVGIVDPFLTSFVPAGQTFWLCLYQGQVTTLRHEWTHPAFPAVGSPPAVVPDKAASEAWIREFLKTLMCYTHYDGAYEPFLEEVKRKHMTHALGSIQDREDLREYEAELVRHVEVVLGIRINLDEFTFDCSC